MAFEFQEGPREGETFRFLRRQGHSRRVQVILAGEEISVRSEDCPDPPCHEYIRIPHNTGGQLLRLREIASNAQIVAELELRVSGAAGEGLTVEIEA